MEVKLWFSLLVKVGKVVRLNRGRSRFRCGKGQLEEVVETIEKTSILKGKKLNFEEDIVFFFAVEYR